MRTVGEDGDGGVAARRAGAPPVGYRELVTACAVAPAPTSSWLELTGEDRGRFLHGQTTCEVQSLVAGQGVYGFFVSPKGRVLADAVISAADDRLVVELPPGRAAAIGETIGRYVVTDRVEISARQPAGAAVLVAGPGAGDLLRRVLDVEPPAAWDHAPAGAGQPAVELRGERRLGLPAWRLAGPRGDLERAVAALRYAGAAATAAAALEAARIERGVPRAGVDYDERHFPQETGVEDWAVSYTKGCYIGQEVVARIHYRGRVHHRPVGLRSQPGAAPPPAGPLVDAEGETAGELTSVVVSPALGCPIGLAILHRRWAAAGTRLAAADGAALEVVELPFVEPQLAATLHPLP